MPVRPGDASVSPYPTGTVRTVPSDKSSKPSATQTWQKGDPIVEPQGVYRLASGKLVMSRECSFQTNLILESLTKPPCEPKPSVGIL